MRIPRGPLSRRWLTSATGASRWRRGPGKPIREHRLTDWLRRTPASLIGRALDRVLANTRLRHAICWRLFAAARYRPALIHALAMHQSQELASFDSAPVDSLDAIHGFEDCYWLFSSNELNLGLSQLQFDEAACIFRLVREYEGPYVIELGRYKGGTTFLLAAAGARVWSIENDVEIERRFRPALCRALERFGLAERVKAETGDAYTCAVDAETIDLVLVHCSPKTHEQVRSLVEHWWPAIRPGGGIILHATPHLPGVAHVVAELGREPSYLGAMRVNALAGEHVLVRKPETAIPQQAAS